MAMLNNQMVVTTLSFLFFFLQKSYQPFETTLKPKQQKRNKKKNKHVVFFLRYWLITGLQKKQIQCVFCFLAFETKKKVKKITREHKQTTSFESKPNTILKVLSFLVSYQFWLF
jgi:hypothetical protein